MKFWVRWDLAIGIMFCTLTGSMFIPSITDGPVGATAVGIVWGAISVGSSMLIGYALRRRHPDLGKPVEREDLLRWLNPKRQIPPRDK